MNAPESMAAAEAAAVKAKVRVTSDRPALEATAVDTSAAGRLPATSSGRPAAAGPGFSARLTAPLLLGSLLNPLNTTMISTALVAIAHTFGIGAADTAWLISVLYLASAVAQPVLGKLADALGPRRVFLAGLVVVIASGLVGTFAPGFGWLIASRLLLGIGTSAAYPAAMAVLRDESRRIGRATPRPVLARLSFAALGSAAIGPTLGGLLVMVVGWRGIFAVNVPVALIALGSALLWIPADPPRTRGADGRVPRVDLDPLGIGLFSTALTVLVFFLLDLAHPMWWLLAPFAALTGVLVWWQLRRPRPFIDLRMLASNAALARTYLRHGLSYLLIYCVMYGFTQWLEEARGYSSGHTGLLMLPMSLAALVCSLLGARTKGIRGPLVAVLCAAHRRVRGADVPLRFRAARRTAARRGLLRHPAGADRYEQPGRRPGVRAAREHRVRRRTPAHRPVHRGHHRVQPDRPRLRPVGERQRAPSHGSGLGSYSACC